MRASGAVVRGIGPATVRFVLALPRTVLRGASPTVDRWSLPRWFLVTFAAVAAGMIYLGRDYYFGAPLFETGDLAANSLQITRATHLLEMYGNYSRFGFHHPGPAFFYVYAVGEALFFNLLHLVPAQENAHLLAGALLQSAFLATAIAVVARFAAPNRGLFVAGAIVVALVHFQLAGNPEFSIWPPDQLVVPFACFVVVAVAVAWGWIALLPVLVLSGGFLVHGHVAQPLYVVPMATLACGLGFWTSFRLDAITLVDLIRRHLKAFLFALAILGALLLPLLRDAIHGPNSNLAAVLTSLNEPRAAGDIHSPSQIVTYFLSFLGYPADVSVLDFSGSQLTSFVAGHWAGFVVSLLALIVLPVALLLSRSTVRASIDADAVADHDKRSSGSGFLAIYFGFLVLSSALTLIWVDIQKGPLFEFNSFFIYGLMFVAFLPSLVVVSRRWPIRRARLATISIAALAVGLTVSTALPLPNAEVSGGIALDESVRAVVGARTSSDPVLLEFQGPDWPQAAAVALALERSNVAWLVEPQWGLIFGSDHLYVPQPGTGAGPEKWFLTPPAADDVGQILLGSSIALYPPPPSLSTYPRTP